MSKIMTYILIPACMALLLVSCDRESIPAAGHAVSVGSVLDSGTRAGGGSFDRGLQPLFLFWTDGNFGNVSVSAPDFFTRVPGGMIDDYSSSVYNTGVRYPIRNADVYAVGLAPAPGDGGLTQVAANDWTRFTIPGGSSAYGDDAHGVVDVLVSNTVSGNDSAPIAAPLVFRHALAQMSFRAILAPTMTKFVKFVTVDFPGSLAPVSVRWDGAASAYRVVAGTDGTDDFTFGNYWTDDGQFLSGSARANATQFYLPSKDKATSMGHLFVAPPDGSSITVTVHYKMCDSVGGFDDPDPANPVIDVAKKITLSFKDAGGNPVSLHAGDAVTITLVFDAADIELVGQLRPWGDGGHVSLPYQPTK